MIINASFKTDSGCFGMEFRDRVEAIQFARVTPGRVVLVESDGVMKAEEMTFEDGRMVAMEINIDGRMVDMMAAEV